MVEANPSPHVKPRARLRSTATVLAEVATELRASSKEAAAVTSEQSSAVAETSATIEEFLLSAEYLLSEGNYEVVLCERGVRTFAKMMFQMTSTSRPASTILTGGMRIPS